MTQLAGRLLAGPFAQPGLGRGTEAGLGGAARELVALMRHHVEVVGEGPLRGADQAAERAEVLGGVEELTLEAAEPGADCDADRRLCIVHPFLEIPVRRHAVRMRFTWCMGGLTFLMFLVTAVTGIYLMFYYRPVAEYAYADMKYLEFDMPFGMLMRNMHRWAAHAMIVFVWLHMFRVFLTGSYKPPREFNWIVGVLLLVLTLLLSFTGYLLPWDQLAIWAVTVGSNMARAMQQLRHSPETALIELFESKT